MIDKASVCKQVQEQSGIAPEETVPATVVFLQSVEPETPAEVVPGAEAPTEPATSAPVTFEQKAYNACLEFLPVDGVDKVVVNQIDEANRAENEALLIKIIL